MRPVVLIIRDGWGVNPRKEGNSAFAAKTPVIDQIRARYPHAARLSACRTATRARPRSATSTWAPAA